MVNSGYWNQIAPRSVHWAKRILAIHATLLLMAVLAFLTLLSVGHVINTTLGLNVPLVDEGTRQKFWLLLLIPISMYIVAHGLLRLHRWAQITAIIMESLMAVILIPLIVHPMFGIFALAMPILAIHFLLKKDSRIAFRTKGQAYIPERRIDNLVTAPVTSVPQAAIPGGYYSRARPTTFSLDDK